MHKFYPISGFKKPAFLFPLLAFLLLCLNSENGLGQASLPIPSYTGGKGTLPTGFTASGLGTDYATAGTKLKFDDASDQLVIFFNSVPGVLSYNILGNPASGSFINGTFLIQQSNDGINYTTIRTITNATNSTISYTDNPLSTSRYIKFIYSIKTAGSVGLGTIALSAGSAPEINVLGNNITISDGDNTPSVNDFTDFGTVLIGNSFNRTFTIQNTGNASLTISGITLTGTNSADFSVITPPSSSIPPLANTTFTVKFTPGAAGIRTAILTINNNDADESAYDFSIQGTGNSPNSITTAVTPFGPYCNSNSNSITLPFTQTGSFTGQFDIQYSNASGFFPLNATSQLLTYISNTATSVTATIPIGFPSGSGYRFRVVNNTPTYYNSAENGSNVIMNEAISITQPANQTVTAPAGTTFSITATGSVSGYQWQVNTGTGWNNLTNVTPYSNVTTAILTINPSNISLDGNSYRCIIKATAPCADVISDAAGLTVFPGPCITDATGYAGWTLSGAASNVAQACSGNGILFTAANQYIVTPAVINPDKLNFNKKRSSDGAAWELKVQISTSSTGPWTDVYSTTTISTTCTANPQIDLSAYTGTQYVRFLDNRPSGAQQRGIDDINITCGAICTPVHTITSFTPVNGPVGTLVTVTGTAFTGATSVKFGTINAASFTVVNATTIIAEAPLNTPTDKIIIRVSGCDAKSASNFTPITTIGTCGTNGSGSIVNDISISEVYDAQAGSLSYIEIFNGTGATVTLGAPNNYMVRINTGAINDYPLTGSIASGATYLIRIGSGTICTGFTPNYNDPSASGFNGNDQIYLIKNGPTGTVIDYVPNPNYPGATQAGFSQRRKATTTAATIPSPAYTAGDWIISTTEDCSNLGIPPYTVGGSSITITTQPADEIDCSAISFTVNATSSAPPPNYVWKYYNSTTDTWDNASALTNATLGVTAGGTASATMTIIGNTAHLKEYQFYCELEEGSCKAVTNAVQYTYPSLPIYRSKVATGNWTAISTWEMSTDGITYTSPVCNYPIALNSDQVIIKNGNTITLDQDLSVDKVMVETGATLTSSANSELTVLNSGTGADFIINGTYVDAANSAHSILFNSGASWSIAANATLIKTGDGSSTNYRDNYETGIANIPANATWIYRYTGSALAFASSSATAPMYYPNLTLENTTASTYSSSINIVTPDLSIFTLTGTNNSVTIKGNFDVGGSGTGNIDFSNINTNSLVKVDGLLLIRSGSILKNGNSAIAGTGFDVKGNIIIDGTFTNNSVNTGLLKLSATVGVQNVSGIGIANLQDVTIANTNSTVALNKSLDIPGVLSFENGSKLDLFTGNITLKSTAAATARVAPIGSGAQINYQGVGKFIIERYFPNRRAWRLLTAPVSNTSSIYKAWQNGGNYIANSGTYITKPFSTGTATDGLEQSLRYSLDTFNVTTGVLDPVKDSKLTLLSGPASGTAAANRGYFMFVRGDRTLANLTPPNSNITTLRDTGLLQTYTKTFSALFPSLAVNSFMLIGNPYASPVDFDKISKTNIIARKFWAWDPRLNITLGAYVIVDGQFGNYIINPAPDPMIGTTGQDSIIQSSQAIFVQVNAPGNASVTFNENDKSVKDNNTVFRPLASLQANEIYESLRANLYLDNADTAILADGTYEQYNNSFATDIDGLDGLKFTNILENLGITSNGKTLALERKPLVKENDTIFFKLWNTTERKYEFRFSTHDLNHPGLEGYLEDSYLKTSTPVDLNGYTNVKFSINGDAASKATNRFRIVFNEAVGGPLPVTFTSVKAYQQSSAINVEWKVENEINIKQYEVERSTDGVSFTGLATVAATGNNSGSIGYQLPDENITSGVFYYRIRSVSHDGKILYSNIVKVVITEGIPRIYVYPNPVIAGSDIGIHFINQPGGRYGIRLLNKLGQIIALKHVLISGINSTQTLPFNKALAHGSYQLEITRPDGSKKNIALIY